MTLTPQRVFASTLERVQVLQPEFRYTGQGAWDDVNDRYVYASNGTGAAMCHAFRQLMAQIVDVDNVIEAGNEVKVIIAGRSRVLNPETYQDRLFYLYEIDTGAVPGWQRGDPSTSWWCRREAVSEFVAVSEVSVKDYLDGRPLLFEDNWFRQAGSARW